MLGNFVTRDGLVYIRTYRIICIGEYKCVRKYYGLRFSLLLYFFRLRFLVVFSRFVQPSGYSWRRFFD